MGGALRMQWPRGSFLELARLPLTHESAAGIDWVDM